MARKIHVQLSDIEEKHVNELCEEKGWSISNIIRTALDVYYFTEQKKKFGYKGADVAKASIKKAGLKSQRDRDIADIRAMDDATLTRWLVDRGYFAGDEPFPNNEKFIRRHTIMERDGYHGYFQQQIDPVSETVTNSRAVYTIDELINDLIKEKII